MFSGSWSKRTIRRDSFLGALDRLRRGCVVADVRMPGMDGIELVAEFERRKIALPVILISGHADIPMAVAAIKTGAEDFIEKPVDDVHLVAAINRGLARVFADHQRRESQGDLAERFARLTPREVEVFDLVVRGLHQPNDRRKARHQHAHGRKLSRATCREDAGGKRCRSGAPVDPPRTPDPVILLPNRFGYCAPRNLLSFG